MFNMIKLKKEIQKSPAMERTFEANIYHHPVTSVILSYCNCHETLMYCILMVVAIWQKTVHKINKLLIWNQCETLVISNHTVYCQIIEFHSGT